MKKEDIIKAYCKIRTIDNTIPDEVLDFMKVSALNRLESKEEILSHLQNVIQSLLYTQNINSLRREGKTWSNEIFLLRLIEDSLKNP
jgi:hypothetical protein